MSLRQLSGKLLAVSVLVVLSVTPSSGVGDTFGPYPPHDQTWVIGNGLIDAAFQLGTDGRFRYRWVHDVPAGRTWRASDQDPSSPINLTVDNVPLNQDT